MFHVDVTQIEGMMRTILKKLITLFVPLGSFVHAQDQRFLGFLYFYIFFYIQWLRFLLLKKIYL